MIAPVISNVLLRNLDNSFFVGLYLNLCKIGLVFMKLAGYNPNESISFWNKMAEQGGYVPQILSTHPSDEARVKDLQAFIDHELDKYID